MSETDYLATIRNLQKVAVECPHVTQADVLDVASMEVGDLRRRALIGRDWHGHFAHCLDGLPELQRLSGTPDGCWDHTHVRMVVEALLAERKRSKA